MAVVWLLLGLAFVAIELHHWAFYAMFGALGAFAAAGVAVSHPHELGAQCVVAIVVAIVGVVAVRPFMSTIVDRKGIGHVARGVHGGIVGQDALTLDEVGDAHHAGHARLAGERWLAVSADGSLIPPHTSARITAVSGTTLVLAVDGFSEEEF